MSKKLAKELFRQLPSVRDWFRKADACTLPPPEIRIWNAIIDALPEAPENVDWAGYGQHGLGGPEPVEVNAPKSTSAFPQQPIVTEANGVRHFKENTMIRFILKRSTENMNTLADAPFTNEERRQFAQLIGYTVDGYNELSYVEDADLGPHSDPPATADHTK